MFDYYTLDDNKIARRTNVQESVTQRKETDIRVDRTTVSNLTVSTVFLCMDLSCGVGPPQLFETMVFGGDGDEECVRYATWNQAVAGHDQMVAKVRDDQGIVDDQDQEAQDQETGIG